MVTAVSTLSCFGIMRLDDVVAGVTVTIVLPQTCTDTTILAWVSDADCVNIFIVIDNFY